MRPKRRKMANRTNLRIRLIVLLSTLSIGLATARADIIYVDTNAASGGDGTSWPTAHRFLQDGLAPAQYGDQIRVAEGNYTPDANSVYPDGTGDRTATFQLVNGVGLHGGFPAAGGDWTQRDPNRYQTILTGDLDGDDEEIINLHFLWFNDFNKLENSYHVLTALGTDPNTVLDGCIITKGYARPSDFEDRGCGGGLYIYAGSPTLVNCAFNQNAAIFGGGGIANISDSSPKVTNCTFERNLAWVFSDRGWSGRPPPDLYGGGIYNEDDSSPTLTNCTFTGNGANYGGGMYSYQHCTPTLTSCTLLENEALNGGGIFNETDNYLTLTDCMFIANASTYGGGMLNVGDSSLTNCTFSENVASIRDNEWGGGGGIANYEPGRLTVNNCSFSNNIAHGDDISHGGGIYNESELTVTDSVFADNKVFIEGLDPHEWSGGYGGAVASYTVDDSVLLTNCLLTGNLADFGGAISAEEYSNDFFILANCVVVGNRARRFGGGLFSGGDGTEVTNCIIWDNRASEGLQIAAWWLDITISYCDVQGGKEGVYLWDIWGPPSIEWGDGAGNIDADPSFVDPGYWDPNNTPTDPNDDFWVDGDYHLQPNSPCIDAGDPNYVTSSDDVDKDDNLRVADGDGDGIARIDMGSYEFQKYCGGTGTAEDPYLICAPVHMQQIGANPDDWDKHFKLTADIDLSAYTDTQFNIIGWYEDGLDNEPFTGVFDGNGHTISNFTYSSAGANYIGLFGYIAGQTAQIKDLVLIDPNINSTAGISIGALAGCIAGGTVSDCYVKGGTITGNKMVGPLAGRTGEATILRCFATSDVMGGGGGIGGLIGDAWYTTISACYATGSVTANSWDVGGLVGHQYGGEILTSYATGTVTTTDNGVGGLIGNGEWMSIVHCYAAGSVRGVDEVGGLVGRYYHGDIIASFWDTLASGQAEGIGYDEETGTVEVYGKTTAQMRQRAAFTDYGWDFAGEIANGPNDVWTIWEGAYYPRLTWENPLAGDFAIDGKWMYQNLPSATTCTLTTTVSVTNDPSDNNSYTYRWEFVLPDDVSVPPSTLTGGGSDDVSWIFAAPACCQPDSLSDSGRPFKVKLTIVGDDHGNTGKAQAEFGIALLGDANNDGVVNVADRSIINAFWRLGAAGPFTFKDCDLNCDGAVNLGDRSIANAVWRGVLGRNRVTQPCPLR